MNEKLLQDILVCPVCRGNLSFAEQAIHCQKCKHTYPIDHGVPVLIPPTSIFFNSPPDQGLPEGKTKSRATLPKARKVIRQILQRSPSLTTWIDLTLFDYLNECSSDMRILNLGSGVGQFDGKIRPHIKMVDLDVYRRDQVDLLADAHMLPFSDESFDAVYSNAVLEHVQRPWVVAKEIYRILRPGGKIFINVPFLNIIHDTHDYFRFTDRGLDILFSDFKKIQGGVSAGPASFLGPFIIEYVMCLTPGRHAKTLVRYALTFLLWPLKYMDFPIRSHPHLRITADAFYFIGIKEANVNF